MPTLFTKKCPKCGNEQFYSCKSSLTLAAKLNKVCKKCKNDLRKVVIPTGGWKRVCKECGKEMKYSSKRAFVLCEKNNGLCRKCGITKWSKIRDLSVFRNEEYRKKQSEMMKRARQTESYGEAFKEKLRKHKVNSFRKNGRIANFNIIACKFIDELNKKFKWDLKHALNGGETEIGGYFVDGYDKKRNVVFEYDEPKHNKKSQIEKDKYRQQIIIDKLNPVVFLRFNEEYKKLIDVVSGKEIL